jgi:hypothetical protein
MLLPSGLAPFDRDYCHMITARYPRRRASGISAMPGRRLPWRPRIKKMTGPSSNEDYRSLGSKGEGTAAGFAQEVDFVRLRRALPICEN